MSQQAFDYGGSLCILLPTLIINNMAKTSKGNFAGSLRRYENTSARHSELSQMLMFLETPGDQLSANQQQAEAELGVIKHSENELNPVRFF